MSNSTWKTQKSRRTRSRRAAEPPKTFGVKLSVNSGDWVEKSAPSEEDLEVRDQKFELKTIVDQLTKLMNSKSTPTDQNIDDYANLSYRAAYLCKLLNRNFASYGLSYNLYQKKFSSVVPYWNFWYFNRMNGKKKGVCDVSTLEKGETFGRCKVCDCTFWQSDIRYDNDRTVYQQQCDNCSVFIGKMKKEEIEKFVSIWTQTNDREARVNGQTMSNWLKYVDENGEVTTIRGCWGSSLFDTELGILVLNDEDKEEYQFEQHDSICDWCTCELLRSGKILHIVHNQI
jgi:hypothetical protein